MKKITVLLADDHAIVREGLRLLLQSTPDIQVVAEAENGHQAVQQAVKFLPHVVLLDIAMPQLDGIDAARLIRKKVPAARVLILSTYNESREVEAALEAGAAGFVMKQTAATELLGAIRETSKGNAWFSLGISKNLADQTRNNFQYGGQESTYGRVLTRRETEVLQLVARGNSNKEMAAALFISIKTIEKHRQAVMNKLNIHEAATLTRYAISNGLIPCERPSLMTLDAG